MGTDPYSLLTGLAVIFWISFFLIIVVGWHWFVFVGWWLWILKREKSVLERRVQTVYSSGHLGFVTTPEPRRLVWSDLFSVGTGLACGVPILATIIGGIAIPFIIDAETSSDEQHRAYGILFYSYDFRLVLTWILTSLISFVGVIWWWRELRRNSVIHASIYALTYWIILRMLLILPEIYTDDLIRRVYYEQIAVLGGESVLVGSLILALIAVTLAVYYGYKSSEHGLLPWICIVFVLPFITMIWIISSLSGFYAANIFVSSILSLAFLGLGIATVCSDDMYMTPLHIKRSLADKSIHRIEIKWILGRIFVLMMIAMVLAVALAWRLFMSHIGLHWAVVALVTAAAYFLTTQIQARKDVLAWSSLVCLGAIIIVLFPDLEYWITDYEISLKELQAMALRWPYSSMAVVGMLGLVCSLIFDIWHSGRAFMVGLTWPMLLIFTLSKPAFVSAPAQVDLLHWVDPMLTLAVVFAIMVVVFGPDVSEELVTKAADSEDAR